MFLLTEVQEAIPVKSIDIITIIPIVISVISLVISIVVGLQNWWSERFKLDFEMVKWFGCNGGGNPIFVWLYVTNYSKIPCSILEITIENQRHEQSVIGYGNGKKKLISTITKSSRDIYSLSYPIKIEPYTSIGGYFHIVSDAGFFAYEEDNVKFTIRTSRGTITKRIFMDYGKNIYRVLQNKEVPKNERMRRSDGSEIIFLNDYNIEWDYECI